MAEAFVCPKCGAKTYTISELRGSSGGITAYLDLDTAIFTAVSCTSCRFTDFYRMRADEFHQPGAGQPSFQEGGGAPRHSAARDEDIFD